MNVIAGESHPGQVCEPATIWQAFFNYQSSRPGDFSVSDRSLSASDGPRRGRQRFVRCQMVGGQR